MTSVQTVGMLANVTVVVSFCIGGIITIFFFFFVYVFFFLFLNLDLQAEKLQRSFGIYTKISCNISTVT